MTRIREEGLYMGQASFGELFESKSSASKGFSYDVQASAIYDNGTWVESEGGSDGILFLTGKEGAVNKRSLETMKKVFAVESLGCMEKFFEEEKWYDCFFTVERHEYNGKVKYRVKNLYSPDMSPEEIFAAESGGRSRSRAERSKEASAALLSLFGEDIPPF